MDPHEITEELGHSGARNLLDSATLRRLAYNGSHGVPPVFPIGSYWNGNQIVICTAAAAPNVRALSSRQNVAVTIDVADTPTEAKALLVRGLASVDIVDGVPNEYIAASTKALGADRVTEFERQVRSMYDRMARISIEPALARFFDFGAGRMPSFLTKLAATPSRQSRATSPNSTSSFVVGELLQSRPLATRTPSRSADDVRRAAPTTPVTRRSQTTVPHRLAGQRPERTRVMRRRAH